MSERNKWWWAFLPKKKDHKSKDFAADFDPFAQPAEKPKEPATAAKSAGDHSQPRQASNSGGSFLSDETFDDSRMESVFNDQTCRRNLNVSRSGRFKEKRKVRSTLPIKDAESAAPAREEAR